MTQLRILMASALLLAAAAADRAEARGADDVVLVTDGQRTLSVSDLLANDERLLDATVELVGDADGATVELSPDGRFVTVILKPDVDLATFQYRPWGFGTSSPASEVLLVRADDWWPIVGRWPTAECPTPYSCGSPYGCDVGAGSEIGWFHIPTGRFRLCDFTGEAVTSCVDVFPPVDGRPWLPVVADLDGDGWDEIGVSDPTSGEVKLFTVDHDRCVTKPMECVAAAHQAQVLPGSLVAAGDWDSDGDETLAFYHQRFGYSLADPDSLYMASPAVADAPGFPLATSYSGVEAMAVWQPSKAHFLIFPNHPGVGYRTVSMERAWGEEEPGPVRGVPFAMPAAACSEEQLLGLYHAEGNRLVLRSSHGSEPVVHVCVPVDPDGPG
ncbi:MAG: hypothetical protein AAGD06_20995 [Acidobacteriota bacterium]